MDVRVKQVVRVGCGVLLTILVTMATWMGMTLWERHRQQHLLIDQQIVPILNQLLQERAAGGPGGVR